MKFFKPFYIQPRFFFAGIAGRIPFDEIPRYGVVFNFSGGDIETAERNIGLNAIFLLLFYSGISGLVIMVWTTRRISQLRDGVEAFTTGDFQTRVPAASGDEIGALGRNFNRMHANVNGNDNFRTYEPISGWDPLNPGLPAEFISQPDGQVPGLHSERRRD